MASLTYEGGPVAHHRQFDKPATRKKSNKGLCLLLGWAAHCSKMQKNVTKPDVMFCQFGTFDSLHGIWNFLCPNTFIWSALNLPLVDFFKNVSQFLQNPGFRSIQVKKDTYLAFSFLFRSVLQLCKHHLKAKFWMYFAQPSFCIFEWCETLSQIVYFVKTKNHQKWEISDATLKQVLPHCVMSYLRHLSILSLEWKAEWNKGEIFCPYPVFPLLKTALKQNIHFSTYWTSKECFITIRTIHKM